MSDIFISYAREDVERVRPVATAMSARGWSVFWDQHIPLSASFREVIEKELKAAKAVLVFWSRHSSNSHWVIEEADAAQQRHILIPVLLDNDDAYIPFGFRTLQTLNLSGWAGDGSAPNFTQLTSTLEKAIGTRVAVTSIPAPKADEPITADHLALVHSSWRAVHKDKEFNDGGRYYQVRVIVFGQDAALDRIEKVLYHLDKAYPRPLQYGTDRKRNFELKELANGFSNIHADVIVKGQIEHIHLSRFINLTETGPRLDLEFFK